MACNVTVEDGIRQEVDCIASHLLAQTPSLLPWLKQLAVVAAHDVPVLLTGETGSGKTYLAHLIHHCSPRKDRRFLVVPCGALAPRLIESELFGHVRGAFTGADKDKEGKLQAADDGALLLDEIDTLGREQQVTLLRVLEKGEFEPVGSNQTKKCRARIMAASNVDLEEAVRQGRFREDLYYRLQVLSFHLPPLRERRQDIAPLALGALARLAQRFHKEIHTISPEALAQLEAFPWPGNIRQLENAVQQAVLLSSGPELQPEDLPIFMREGSSPRANGRLGLLGHLARPSEIAERDLIKQALQNCNYSRGRAAGILGISRVTLYKKIKKYGLLERPAGEE